jgi:hypothetical protein
MDFKTWLLNLRKADRAKRVVRPPKTRNIKRDMSGEVQLSEKSLVWLQRQMQSASFDLSENADVTKNPVDKKKFTH